MLRISVNDKDLDLLNVSITLKYENPLFSSKPFNTGYSYSFDLPATERNQNIFNHSERIDSTKNIARLNAKVYVSGILFFTGVINVSKNSDTTFSCSLNSDGLDMYKVYKETQLENLDFDTIQISADGTDSEDQRINWRAYLDNKLTLDEAAPEDTDHFFPCIINEDCWEIKSPVLVDAAAGGEGYYYRNPTWSGILNLYLNNHYFVNHLPVYADFFPTSITACPKYLTVLEKMFEQDDLELVRMDEFSDPEMDNLIFYSNRVLAKYGTTLAYSHTPNYYGENYNLNDFLPNTNKLDYVLALKELFGCVYLVLNGRVKIRTTRAIVKSEPLNFTKYSEKNYIVQHSEFKNFKFFYEQDEQDRLSKEDEGIWLKKEVIIDEDEKITDLPSRNRCLSEKVDYNSLKFQSEQPVIHFPLLPAYNGYCHSYLHNYWQTDDKAQVGENQLSVNKDRLLLMFWRGMHNAEPGYSYPLASISSKDPSGSTLGKFSLDWNEEETGLYDYFWSDFLDKTNGATTITKLFYLKPHDIKKLSNFEQPNIEFYNEKGHVETLIKSFEVQVSTTGISPIKAELLKKNTNRN